MGKEALSPARISTGIMLAMGISTELFQGCIGSDDGDRKRTVQVKPRLVRAEGIAAAAKTATIPTVSLEPDLHWSSGVSISSLRVPIKQISLHSAAFDHEADLYLCSGSSEACQVEMAGTAFQDALNAASRQVEMGQYDYVFVKTCEDSEGEYRTALTGSVPLDGKTWYTNAASVLDSVGPAAPVSITSHGCGRTYTLPHPLRITDSLGASVDFTLYFDIQELAYAALGSRKTAAAWTPGNCTGERPAETDAASPPFLCIGYPEVSGIISAAPAVLERYRVNGGSTIGMFFTADDIPLGGYTRRYYTEGVRIEPGFDALMALRNVRKNSDGTLFVDGFGPGGHAYDTTMSVFRAAAFSRANHTGTFTTMTEATLATSTVDYGAVRLTR